MENNSNNAKNERIFDAMLKIVADESLREEMDALPNDEELMELYPNVESLNKKAYAIINREFRAINRRKSFHMLVRVAAIFCVVLVLGTGIIMATPVTRNFFLNLLIDIQYDHVVFDFGVGTTPDISAKEFAFDYIPFGFSLTGRQIMETMETYIFENSNGNVIIKRRFLGRSLTVGMDTDYADFTEIQLVAGIAHIFVAVYENDFSTIRWVRDEDNISISTNLDVETLIKLAEHYMAR